MPGSFVSTTLAEITFKTTGSPLHPSSLLSHLKNLIPPPATLVSLAFRVRLFLPSDCEEGRPSRSLLGCPSLCTWPWVFIQETRSATHLYLSLWMPGELPTQTRASNLTTTFYVPFSYLTSNVSIDPTVFTILSSHPTQRPLPESKLIPLVKVFLSFWGLHNNLDFHVSPAPSMLVSVCVCVCV